CGYFDGGCLWDSADAPQPPFSAVVVKCGGPGGGADFYSFFGTGSGINADFCRSRDHYSDDAGAVLPAAIDAQRIGLSPGQPRYFTCGIGWYRCGLARFRDSYQAI